jgi:hypothetical protein
MTQDTRTCSHEKASILDRGAANVAGFSRSLLQTQSASAPFSSFASFALFAVYLKTAKNAEGRRSTQNNQERRLRAVFWHRLLEKPATLAAPSIRGAHPIRSVV